jgi:dedicator of cytokinesis protein 1
LSNDEIFLKFVVQSRTLFSKLNEGKGREPFQQLLRGVLHSLTKLMFATTQDLLQGQIFCLRHMVQAIPDLATVFEQRQLTEIIVQMVQNLPKGQLADHKMLTLKSLVSELLKLLFGILICPVMGRFPGAHPAV